MLAPWTLGTAILLGLTAAVISAYVAVQTPGINPMYVVAGVYAAGYVGGALCVRFAAGGGVRTAAVTAVAAATTVLGFAPVAVGIAFAPAAILWLVIAVRYEKRYRVPVWKLAVSGIAGVGAVAATLVLAVLVLA